MNMDGVAPRKGWWLRVWGWVDTARRTTLNLIFVLIVVLLGVGIFSSGDKPKLEEKTALVLALNGPLVEQKSGDLQDRLAHQAQGQESAQTQLRDVFAVLLAAAKDPKIDRVVLILDDMEGAGLTGLREVAAAIEAFKASGKQVVAWGSNYNQRQYYLAAHANEVYLHPMGMAAMEGYGRTRNYYKDVFERVGVTPNVIRVGTYKNAAEPYFANEPSEATKESDAYLYDALWLMYTEGVEKARKLPAGSVVKAIEQLPQRFEAVQGNAAKLALNEKWVDGLKTRDELRAMLIERGAQDKESKSFRQIGFGDYLATLKPVLTGDSIGIVVAEGEISEGMAPPGKIGGRSTAELIRKARDDASVKAVVLRVRSPGGSAFGSELIRRELELTRAAGKPVVVSMGDVAASGGYWISMAADEIIADAATITGSIGVFAVLPTAEKLMDKLSLHTGGYSTTWLANAYDPRLPMDPRFAALVQASVGNIYTDFTTKAAAARKTTVDKIDAVAQGRVWTGAQAKDRGLIDRVGSFDDAVQAAKTRAKLPETARLVYLERDPGKLEQLLSKLGMGSAAVWAHNLERSLLARISPPGVPAAIAADAAQEMAWLTETTQRGVSGLPYLAFTHCLCDKY